VTGSSRGIGAAIALRLASHGANLVINYVASAAAAEAVVAKIRALGVEAIAVQADVSKPAEIKRMFAYAVSKFGRLDVVMSNSGIEHFGDLTSVTEEEIDRVLAVNVKAQYVMSQQGFEHLADNGRLILISSTSAVCVSAPLLSRSR
jgi:tetrahydroxynaphthalene reductase